MIIKNTLVFIILSLVSFSVSAETRFCELPTFYTGDADPQESIEGGILSEIGKIQASDTLTPLVEIQITGKNGEMIYEGNATQSYFEFINLDEIVVEYGALILGFDPSDLFGYQIDVIEEDGGDGTGFSMMQFTAKNGDHLGTLVNLGWGFATCAKEGKTK